MAIAPGLRDYLFDVLAPLGKIETKLFFGLDGIKAGGAMLGFVLDQKIYFRTDEGSRSAYTKEGGKPFTFDKAGELIVTSYYAVPDRLYDEPEELARWAQRARVAALEAPSAVKRRQKNARKTARNWASTRRQRKRHLPTE
jgi:DNA transformation protein